MKSNEVRSISSRFGKFSRVFFALVLMISLMPSVPATAYAENSEPEAVVSTPMYTGTAYAVLTSSAQTVGGKSYPANTLFFLRSNQSFSNG